MAFRVPSPARLNKAEDDHPGEGRYRSVLAGVGDGL
jgi:hypothetical protein